MSNRSREALVLGGAAALLFVYALWRATLGITLTDDGYYVSMGLRLAQGARVFTDERFVQALGFLLTGPFTKAWTTIVGLGHLALALRVFYVVLATAAGIVAYRALAPGFGRTPSAVAIAALLLVPPFNIPAVSYNSMGMLGLVLGCALAWRAVGVRWSNAESPGSETDPVEPTPAREHRSVPWAAAAVVALALASVSYPPLVVPAAVAFVLLGLLALLGRDRRAVLAMLLAAAGSLAVFGIWFFTASSVDGLRATLEFASVHRTVGLGLDNAWSGIVVRLWQTVSGRFYLPMWLFALSAAFAPHAKVRAVAEATLPFAAAYPGVRALAAGADHRSYGVLGAAYLLALGVGLALPVVAGVVRDRDASGRRLLLLTGPAALVGYVAVAYTTQAGWYWGMPLVGAAPLLLAELTLSLRRIGRELGAIVLGVVSIGLVGLLVALLTITPFKSPRPWHLDATIADGAYAGLRVDARTAAATANIMDAGRRWVGADDTVFVTSGAGAYPLIGGRIYTPSVWLNAGPTSQAAVDYFDDRGAWPDVVFMKPAPEELGANDPLVARMRRDYRVVDVVEGFTIWRRGE